MTSHDFTRGIVKETIEVTLKRVSVPASYDPFFPKKVRLRDRSDFVGQVLLADHRHHSGIVVNAPTAVKAIPVAFLAS
jgi:hypothetical protein